MSHFSTIDLACPPPIPAAEFWARRTDDRPAAAIEVTPTPGPMRLRVNGSAGDATCSTIERLVRGRLAHFGW
jgi:hypothetical protein